MIAMRADMAMLQAPAKEHARSQKGNVLVEFALILPLFVLLLFGMVTFSIALYDKTILTIATRDGARAGAIYVSGSSSSDRINSAQTTASSACGDLISFGAGASPTVTASISGDLLTVTAVYYYTGVYIFSDGFSISATTSMRLEVP
jgi:Flp pilus assembly protein TadG